MKQLAVSINGRSVVEAIGTTCGVLYHGQSDSGTSSLVDLLRLKLELSQISFDPSILPQITEWGSPP